MTLPAEELRRDTIGTVMELLGRAAPGVELRAEQAVESACHLADAADPVAVPGTRSPRRAKRRGLGPGFQGIR